MVADSVNDCDRGMIADTSSLMRVMLDKMIYSDGLNMNAKI